jgi:hypothetical protein
MSGLATGVAGVSRFCAELAQAFNQPPLEVPPANRFCRHQLRVMRLLRFLIYRSIIRSIPNGAAKWVVMSNLPR